MIQTQEDIKLKTYKIPSTSTVAQRSTSFHTKNMEHEAKTQTGQTTDNKSNTQYKHIYTI